MAEPCRYCGVREGKTQDHVIPRSVRLRYEKARELVPTLAAIPAHLLVKVPACGACNRAKGARRWVPPSLAHLIPELNRVFGGTRWAVFDGLPKKARTLCVYCDKVVTAPVACRYCRKALHDDQRCKSGHGERCAKARRARERRRVA